MTDWEKLTKDEKHFIAHILAFFAASCAPARSLHSALSSLASFRSLC